MSGTVSVVIPAYNVEAYIRRCIDSVLAQTHHDIDVVIVDDGSTDRTAEICDHYARSDSRVRVIRQENSGVASARNAALDVVVGQWVMFVDGDDTLPADAVENLLNVARSSRAGCVTGRFEAFSEDVPTQASRGAASYAVLDSNDAREQLLYQQTIPNAPFAKLFDLQFAQGVRFPPGVTVAEDLYFNFEALGEMNAVAVTETIVYHYRVRPDSAMNARFTPARMDGLAMTSRILTATEKTGREDLVQAARSRHFMEAIFVGVQIAGSAEYSGYYSVSRQIIREQRIGVVRNGRSPLAYRAIAVVAVFNVRLALEIVARRAKAQLNRR